uniref:NADP-dependent oxidoreductase domain-containing protein n=1 Tax=Tetradesmus obliquus TaxID=3088 RepID=A0A383V526_TETOB|eukprot:jgi/Sobl393_1/15598/SZX60705.1
MQAAQLLQQRPVTCPAVTCHSSRRLSSTVSCKSLNRRDLIAGTSGLLVWTAADRAVATEDGQPQAEAAAAPLQDAAQEQAAAAASSGDSKASAAAAQKRRKKRPAAKAKQKAAAKAPGTVPRVKLTDQLEVSKVIRGCWQLDGQHKGDQLSDRTSGTAAIEDLDAFSRAGMFTLDTADIYGPSEAIIGQYLRLNPAAAMRTKVSQHQEQQCMSTLTCSRSSSSSSSSIASCVQLHTAQCAVQCGLMSVLHLLQPINR